jgi:hypothetical protein
MDTIRDDRESVEIGGRIMYVTPLKAQEIRKRIVARLKRSAQISGELRRERLLPAGHRNQTGSLIGSNYSKSDVIDRRAINHVVSGMTAVLETRFQNTLRREWTA